MRLLGFVTPSTFRTPLSIGTRFSSISSRRSINQRKEAQLSTLVTMGGTEYKYVIVGAGNSAGYAARQFIDLGIESNSLCVIGDEPVAPYERPALSKAVIMNKDVRLPGFHTCVGGGGDKQPPDWYESNGIALRLSEKVESIDAKSKTATLSDGSTVTAKDAMIVATGCSAMRLSKTPGHDLEGIYYLRNNQDALRLYEGLQAASGKPVVVIGGSYIGMEVTAAAVQVGCKVTMVFPEPYMMSKLFTPEIGEMYEAVYRAKGVDFIKHDAYGKAFVADDSGSAVSAVTIMRKDRDKDEDVPAAAVIVGVGAQPQTDILRDQADLDDSGGVIVNGKLETSANGVYAIGDIASFPLKLYEDRQTRMEHVQNCRDMAKHVANVIVKGDTSDYDYLPYFYSRVFNLAWKFYGDNTGDAVFVSDGTSDEMVDAAMNDKDVPQMIAVWVDNGVLQGVFMESPSDDDVSKMQSVVREKPSLDMDKLRQCKTVSDVWSVIA